jgi:hypothetical protein
MLRLLEFVPHPASSLSADVWWRKDYPLIKACRFYQWSNHFSKYDIQFHNAKSTDAQLLLRQGTAIFGNENYGQECSPAVNTSTSINMTMNASARRAIPGWHV